MSLMVICTSLFFFLFSPSIAKVEGRFDWSPGFTGHGSSFRVFLSLFCFYFPRLARALKGQLNTIPVILSLPESQSPPASTPSGFHPSLLYQLWVAQCHWNGSQALHTRTSPRSRQVTYPPINEGSTFVAFCTDVADAYVGRKWEGGGEKGHALSIDVYHCSMYYPIHS